MPPQYDATSPAHLVAPGTIIAERYRIEAMLGEGGMGIVYLAEHVHIRKRVALKVLLPQWTSAPEVVARFEREAVAAGAIAHPNVAAATDFGRLADGSFFLVLEYLEGRTLRTELETGTLPPTRALAIARGIALGVGAAHAKGIVHRDLKPENVMLVERGADPDFVKVLDFGVACLGPGRETDGQALTSAGEILGTPDYMAPEQALGTSIDARADLYALGVILFEMLTGECPFRGGAVTLLRQHLLTPSPPLPAGVADRLPPEARLLVARLLEKEPGARYASTTELLVALARCIAALEAPGGAPALDVPRRAEGVVGVAKLRMRAPFDPRRGVMRAVSLLKARAAAALTGAREPRRRPLVLAAVTAVAVIILLAWTVGTSASSHPLAIAPAALALPPPPSMPPPTPAPSALTTPASPPAAAQRLPPVPSSTSPRRTPRRTGPGGIYIPPPSQWFK